MVEQVQTHAASDVSRAADDGERFPGVLILTDVIG
jgi:hypothetical protein